MHLSESGAGARVLLQFRKVSLKRGQFVEIGGHVVEKRNAQQNHEHPLHAAGIAKCAIHCGVAILISAAHTIPCQLTVDLVFLAEIPRTNQCHPHIKTGCRVADCRVIERCHCSEHNIQQQYKSLVLPGVMGRCQVERIHAGTRNTARRITLRVEAFSAITSEPASQQTQRQHPAHSAFSLNTNKPRFILHRGETGYVQR